MELEISKPYKNEDLEDGEISDNSDGYTPLQRPEMHPSLAATSMQHTNKMDDKVIEDVSDFSKSSDSDSSDSDDCMKTQKVKKKQKRTMLLRVKQLPQMQNESTQKAKFKRYDVWTASSQEDSLMENMRGIDVAKYQKRNDRNVENYDYSLKYHLNGENKLKRRLSNSGDDMSDDNNFNHQSKKRRCNRTRNRHPKKDYMDQRSGSSNSSDSQQNAPRHIIDLNITDETKDDDIARQIANRLYEQKDELLLRIVEVLGREIPMELFKETQRIELEGGMMIMNGDRRRTPGGVFLFLLKHHDNVTAEEKKDIFTEERKNSVKIQKTMQARKRDQKVEELKKRLSEKDLRTTRAEPTVCHLKPESATLSNPPPSPVTSGGHEYSPEYKSHAINHVGDASPEKPSPGILSELEDITDAF